MSVDEMKKIVHQQIDSLTESQLEQVNRFIGTINNPTINLTNNYNTVKSQYSDVLKKLAQ